MNKSIGMLIKCIVLIFLISFSLPVSMSSESGASSRVKGNSLKKKYNFSTDWFSMNIPRWEKILRDFKGKPGINYLEIGLFEGRSFFWMLENILTHSTSTATGIDPFSPKVEEVFMSNLKLSGLQDKVKVLKGYAQVEVRNLPDHSFDIIYIDGDHSSAGVLVNAVFCWRLLRKGGLLIFDDYGWHKNNAKKPPTAKPQIAVDGFLASLKRQIDVIHKQYQCIIRKKEFLYWEKERHTN